MSITKDFNKAHVNATRSALNKVIKSARTAAMKKIREEYNIKARDLRKVMDIDRASNKNPEAGIKIIVKKPPLIAFGARQTKKGVTVKVRKAGGRKLVKSAFIATLKSGHTSVFRRSSKERLPIDKLLTADVIQMFEKEGEKAALETINKKFEQVLEHELRFFLNRFVKI